MKVKLSNKFVSAIKPITDNPNPQRFREEDPQFQGLVLKVTRNGSKSFYFEKRINGRLRVDFIGKFPIWSVSDAKKEINHKYELLRAGRGSNQSTLKITLEEALKLYWDDFAIPHGNDIDKDDQVFRIHLQEIKDFKITEIRKKDILKIHAFIGGKGKYNTANKAVALVKKIYNFLADYYDYEGNNPANGIKKFPEEERDRYLLDEEIRPFFLAAKQEVNPYIRYYHFLLFFTATRGIELQTLSWDRVDLDRSEITVMAAKKKQIKNAKRTIYLSPEAKIVLEALKANRINEWVFPSVKSKTGHIHRPSKNSRTISELAGLKDFKMHDLRTTFATYLRSINCSELTVGAVLGHSENRGQGSTRKYARVRVDTVREWTLRGASDLFKISGLKIEDLLT